MKKVAILEPGAWGTALGILLSKKSDVSFWYENRELALKLSRARENERLPGIKIPGKIFILSDLRKAIKEADLIIVASPSFNFRKTLTKLKKCIGDTYINCPSLVGIAKGIEKETLKVPSQIAEEIFGKIPYAHLSGPGFAKEIIRGKSAKEVIASRDEKFLKQLEELFQIKPLEISTTTDLVGVQLAGALKNTLSIGISLAEAGLEDSEIEKIKRGLIYLGLREMIKIGKVMGAEKETFLGPAGLGDLILTSTSPLSRNFQFGQNLLLDANKMRRDIIERKITVEGFDNVFALHKLGRMYKLDLPMINEIYKVIYKKTSSKRVVKNLTDLIK